VHIAHLVHVISAKHFTSGYDSEILHAVCIPLYASKFHREATCKPSNDVGVLNAPTGQYEICKLL